MFGFSFQKIIFTVLAVAAVWYAFKWIGRLQEQRDAKAKVDAKRRPSGVPPGGSAADDFDDVEEMVKCKVCGDYVSKTAAVNCGRDGCPYRG